MTIGIAVLMSDSIMFVADGRMRRFDAPGQPILSDDVNKIFLIGQSFAVVTCGVSQVTDTAAKQIEFKLQPHNTLNEVLNLVSLSLEESWKFHAPRFPPGLDLTDPHINATLLIGGLAAGTEFIGLAQHHYLGKRPSKVASLSDSLQFLIVCVEQEIASDYFEARLIDRLALRPASMEIEERIRLMIEAAAETVRFMETRDLSIGGTIRYLILRRGTLPEAGIRHD
jgi:hypothetical protein